MGKPVCNPAICEFQGPEFHSVRLDFYWCVTNYHKFNSLKQHIFIISECQWVRNQSTAQWSPLLQVPQTAMKVSCGLHSFWEHGVLFQASMAIGRIQVCDYQLPSCQLWTGDTQLLQAAIRSLPCGPFHRFSHNMVVHFGQVSKTISFPLSHFLFVLRILTGSACGYNIYLEIIHQLQS